MGRRYVMRLLFLLGLQLACAERFGVSQDSRMLGEVKPCGSLDGVPPNSRRIWVHARQKRKKQKSKFQKFMTVLKMSSFQSDEELTSSLQRRMSRQALFDYFCVEIVRLSRFSRVNSKVRQARCVEHPQDLQIFITWRSRDCRSASVEELIPESLDSANDFLPPTTDSHKNGERSELVKRFPVPDESNAAKFENDEAQSTAQMEALDFLQRLEKDLEKLGEGSGGKHGSADVTSSQVLGLDNQNAIFSSMLWTFFVSFFVAVACGVLICWVLAFHRDIADVCGHSKESRGKSGDAAPENRRVKMKKRRLRKANRPGAVTSGFSSCEADGFRRNGRNSRAPSFLQERRVKRAASRLQDLLSTEGPWSTSRTADGMLILCHRDRELSLAQSEALTDLLHSSPEFAISDGIGAEISDGEIDE